MEFLEKRRSLSLILTILTIIEIFYISSRPGTRFDAVGVGLIPIGVIYHFAIFFLLAFFLLTTIKGDKKLKTSYIIFILIIAIFYAILDEIHQLFVPMRYASIEDILTDTLGILSSILIQLYVNKKVNSSKK